MSFRLRALLLSLVLLIGMLLTVTARVNSLSPCSDNPINLRDNGTMFVENVGQFAPDVRFQARGVGGGTLWLTADAVWFTVIQSPSGPPRRPFAPAHRQTLVADDAPRRAVALRLSFPGANPNPKLEPFDPRDATLNYHRGSDPEGWHTGVPVWGGVRYRDLYPGIDLAFGGANGDWTWRLVVRDPQISPQDLRLRVEGAERVSLDGDALKLSTFLGELALPLIATPDWALEQAPRLSQGESLEILFPFAPSLPSEGDGVSSPQAPQDDPDDLLLGTFLGADNDDSIRALTLGADGSIYVTGRTESAGFPTTPGAYDSSLDGDDLFVTKLDPSGSQLLYSTFLGGSGVPDYEDETVRDIVVDQAGRVYVTGATIASDFPTTPGAYDPTYNVYQPYPQFPPAANIFITRLDASGGLSYSTYLGFAIMANGIAVDEAGAIYVAGQAGYMTATGDPVEPMPTTPGAYDPSLNDSGDVIVAKLDPAGNGQADLVYGTYVGKTAHDYATDVAVDEAGVVYVSGFSEGDFPTTEGAYDRSFNGGPCQYPPFCETNVLFFKLAPAGNGQADLLYSTYLGGEAELNEVAYGLVLDDEGVAYLTGSTWVDDWPTTAGAFDDSYNGIGDAFVLKLDPAGNGQADLLYSTYLGGRGIDTGLAIDIDGDGDVYVTGSSGGSAGSTSDFPITPDAFQSTRSRSGSDFVSRLRPQGNGDRDLVYSSFLGGNDLEDASAVAAVGDETAYVAGDTQSSDFPTTPDAYDPTFGGGVCSGGYPCEDGYIVRLRVGPEYRISGRLQSSDGAPIPESLVTVRDDASQVYSATTDADGAYALDDLPGGTYTLTPPLGYFWTPSERVVTPPPDASDQDFVGRNLRKRVTPAAYQGTLSLGDRLTYTLEVVYPWRRSLRLYEPIPTHTTYVSGSLSGPEGLFYDPEIDCLRGMFGLAAGQPATISFAVQLAVQGTTDLTPIIVNRACFYPSGGEVSDCEWSNQVWTFTHAMPVYLPIVIR